MCHHARSPKGAASARDNQFFSRSHLSEPTEARSAQVQTQTAISDSFGLLIDVIAQKTGIHSASGEPSHLLRSSVVAIGRALTDQQSEHTPHSSSAIRCQVTPNTTSTSIRPNKLDLAARSDVPRQWMLLRFELQRIRSIHRGAADEARCVKKSIGCAECRAISRTAILKGSISLCAPSRQRRPQMQRVRLFRPHKLARNPISQLSLKIRFVDASAIIGLLCAMSAAQVAEWSGLAERNEQLHGIEGSSLVW